MSYIDVFERKEVKYRLGESQYRSMLDALRGRMEPDQYGTTLITSVYYDTPNRMMIQRSLEKPLYKEKLRLRSYGAVGVPNSRDRVFVEIKKKYDGVVYKRRVAMSYRAACAYLAGVPYEQVCRAYPLPDPIESAEAFSPRSVQIAREIDALVMRCRPLFASMSISCERTAFAPLAMADDVPDDLRITFDEGIRYRDMFAPRHASPQRPLLPDGDVVMEVKSGGAFPIWLADALSGCGAYPSSFSKYGEAYRAVVMAPSCGMRPGAVAEGGRAASPFGEAVAARSGRIASDLRQYGQRGALAGRFVATV